MVCAPNNPHLFGGESCRCCCCCCRCRTARRRVTEVARQRRHGVCTQQPASIRREILPLLPRRREKSVRAGVRHGFCRVANYCGGAAWGRRPATPALYSVCDNSNGAARHGVCTQQPASIRREILPLLPRRREKEVVAGSALATYSVCDNSNGGSAARDRCRPYSIRRCQRGIRPPAWYKTASVV